MASIGVFKRAQYPQTASKTYARRIRKRFFSENPISLLIIAFPCGCALSGLHSLRSCSLRVKSRAVDSQQLPISDRFHGDVPWAGHGDRTATDVFRTVPREVNCRSH